MAREDPFAFLHDLRPQELARCLAGETETLGGVVLAQLPPALAAKVLANMTADRQRAVVGAMRRARQVPAERLQRLAATLQEKLNGADAAPAKPDTSGPAGRRGSRLQAWTPRRVSSDKAVNAPPEQAAEHRRTQAMQQALEAAQRKASGGPSDTSSRDTRHRSPRSVDGMALAAQILRFAPEAVRHNIAEEEPALYQQLRSRMFVFEDLVQTNDRDLSEVFTAVEPKTAALALRFAPPALTQRALEVISSRRSALIRDEMEAGAAGRERVRVRDIEAAQQTVLTTALALQKAGRVVIDPHDPDLAS